MKPIIIGPIQMGEEMGKPFALILCGDGINCERETAAAFDLVGFNSKIVHINDLVKRQSYFKDVQVLAFPGGFSFGDELGSGKLLALKLKYQLQDYLNDAFNKDTLAIGICNGFQALVSLGFLPGNENQSKLASLAYNLDENHARKPFLNRWITLNSGNSNCIWTKGIKEISLPVRHGEGRLVFKDEEKTFELLNSNNQIPFYYEENINGSYKNIAGLSDGSGKLFGLMPHPEAAMFAHLSPSGEPGDKNHGDGYTIFKNSFNYFQ